MKRQPVLAAIGLAVAIGTGACSRVTEVSPADVAQVVARDAVPFTYTSFPATILDRLSDYRIVMVGEQHFLREHRQLVFELLRQLHARGFRQLLFEWTQVADWLVTDFVHDGGLEPDWAPPLDIGGDLLATIRDFNRTVPVGERIDVHPIDATLDDYGGRQSFLSSIEALAEHLPAPGPLAGFLNRAQADPGRYADHVVALEADLVERRSELVRDWGRMWYDRVVEMAEVEDVSITIRALRNDRYDDSVRLREELLKLIADRRIADSAGGTVLNFGLTHAQKERLTGTDNEWLGDYLVHRSTVVDGSAIVIGVVPARVIPSSGDPIEQLEDSPSNELFRVIHETWPGTPAWMALDDPLFMSDGVPLNLGGEIRLASPKRHYDAFVVLPLAHRVTGS
jgi:hypothetical protein